LPSEAVSSLLSREGMTVLTAETAERAEKMILGVLSVFGG
jgi:hypothetical protein